MEKFFWCFLLDVKAFKSFLKHWSSKNIVLAKVRQRKTSAVFHLYVESKKGQTCKKPNKMVVTRSGGGEIRQMLLKDTNLQQVMNKS